MHSIWARIRLIFTRPYFTNGIIKRIGSMLSMMERLSSTHTTPIQESRSHLSSGSLCGWQALYASSCSLWYCSNLQDNKKIQTCHISGVIPYPMYGISRIFCVRNLRRGCITKGYPKRRAVQAYLVGTGSPSRKDYCIMCNFSLYSPFIVIHLWDLFDSLLKKPCMSVLKSWMLEMVKPDRSSLSVKEMRLKPPLSLSWKIGNQDLEGC